MSNVRVHIAVGVIFNRTRDTVLLAKRPAHVSHGGLWEFPGGKLEAGESVNAALRRELHEELELDVRQAVPLFCVDYDYPATRVRLDVWTVDEWGGNVHGREGQEIEWVPVSDLWQREFLPANKAIVRWLCLPALYLITPDLRVYDRAFLSRLETLLAAGVRLLQFRSSHLSPAQRQATARKIAALCTAHRAHLLVNGSPLDAVSAGAQGVHLNSERLMRIRERPRDGGQLVAASVHNAAEMDQAVRMDVDLAVIGPVAATATHPRGTPLGWEGFAALARGAGRPVYALGGMQPGDLERARQWGGKGVAMIRGIWDAGDPAAAIRACLP